MDPEHAHFALWSTRWSILRSQDSKFFEITMFKLPVQEFEKLALALTCRCLSTVYIYLTPSALNFSLGFLKNNALDLPPQVTSGNLITVSFLLLNSFWVSILAFFWFGGCLRGLTGATLNSRMLYLPSVTLHLRTFLFSETSHSARQPILMTPPTGKNSKFKRFSPSPQPPHCLMPSLSNETNS